MKTTKIYYKRLYSLPDYQNKEVGIEIELETEDTEEMAINKAIDFVELQNPEVIRKIKDDKIKAELKKCETILSNAGDYTEEEEIINTVRF